MTNYELWKVRFKRSFIFISLYWLIISTQQKIDFGVPFTKSLIWWAMTVIMIAGLHWFMIKKKLDVDRQD